MLDADIFNVPEQDLTSAMIKGEGKKKLLLLARKSDLLEGGKEKLGAIIKAINYDINEDCYICIFDDHKVNLPIGPILRKLEIKDLIVFGVNPKEIGFYIQAKLYTNFNFENVSFILSHRIHEMNANRQFKLALWGCLQKQFLGK